MDLGRQPVRLRLKLPGNPDEIVPCANQDGILLEIWNTAGDIRHPLLL